MKCKYLLVFSLLCVAVSAAAQDLDAFWRQTKEILNGLSPGKKDLDPAYALQPELKWTATLEGTGIRMGTDLYSDIQITDLSEDNPRIIDAKLEMGMKKRLYKKVGGGLSYGGLGMSFGFEVGKRSPKRNTYFNFGTTKSFYGWRIQYYKTHEYVEGTLDVDLEGFDTMTLTSEKPCQARDLTIDGFYAFNRNRFVYTATYGGRIVQRRSAGSWMVAAKYLQGDFSLDKNDDVLISLLNGLNRYATMQALAGGGYSYNWVILHRDPQDRNTWKGLQNLTVNVTALPMISLLNNIRTDQGSGRTAVRTRFKGQPAFSPTLRAGICYSWDRYFINVHAGYNRFGFHGAETLVEENNGQQRSKVNTRGVFYDLTAKVQLNVRF